MYWKLKGFTLLELLVVITLIAVVASIAVPNFLRSKMAANETSAIASLRKVVEAQSIYKRTDWDSDGQLEYCLWFDKLYTSYKGAPPGSLAQTSVIELIDQEMLKAYVHQLPFDVGLRSSSGAPMPKGGYLFSDVWSYFRNGAWQNVYGTGNPADEFTSPAAINVIGYGIVAVPFTYNMTGHNIFAADDYGVLWQKDGALEEQYTTLGFVDKLYNNELMSAGKWVGVE